MIQGKAKPKTPVEELETRMTVKIKRDKHLKIPLISSNAERYMRDQMVTVFATPAQQLKTTSEYKRISLIEKDREEAVEVVAKAVAKARAAEIRGNKVETVKKYMEYMSQQQEAKQQRESFPTDTQEAWAWEKRKTSKPKTRHAIKAKPLKVSPIKSTPESFSGTGSGESSTEHPGEFAGEYDHERKDSFIRPSWTYFDQMGEDDDGIHVSVGAESRDRPTTPFPKPKMYNVSLGVRPKDIAKVYQTPPWHAINPKKYNVSVGVEPGDFALTFTESEMELRRLKKIEDEIAGELLPEDELTPEEMERRRLERIRLMRKPSKRFEASTLARPAGYRELKLAIPMEGLAFEHTTQVSEFEIERTMAAKRGIYLPEGNILWPMNRQFTQEFGKRSIEDYIKRSWKLEKEWMYHVRFIQSHNTNYFRRYVFEAQFSIPTFQVPVPPATASVYFVFEIGHYSGLDDTIKIHYCLEGTRFAHIPGHLPFNSKWLHGIIADKLRVQRAMDF